MLPILHLNGYKIANPTIFKSMSDEELTKLFEGYGWHPLIVEGDDLDAELAEALDTAYGEIRELQEQVRGGGKRPERPRWPMIVLKSPKGWTGPKEVDGVKVEGTSKAHQVPAMKAKSDPGHLKILEDWLRSYGPEELFDENGGPIQEILAACPTGDLRMGANPHVNGGKLRKDLKLPDLADARARRLQPGRDERQRADGSSASGTRTSSASTTTRRNFRIMCPDEVASNRLGAVFEATDHAWEWPLDPEIDTGHAPDGRIMEVLSEHNCQGWLQGYVLTGRHGVFPCYEAFIPIVDGMVNQYSKFLKMSKEEAPWREPVAGLNYLLTSVGWRQDHNGYSHQMPGFINSMLNRKEDTARVYLPPDANTLLATMEQRAPVHAHDQPRDRLQAPAAAVAVDRRGARARRARGATRLGVGEHRDRRAGHRARRAAARSPTIELLAAAELLRKHVPDLTRALRRRDRPVHARAARGAPARDGRGGVRGALHRGQAGDLQLPRLPVGDPPADPPPARRRSASASAATRRRGRRRRRSSCSR